MSIKVLVRGHPRIRIKEWETSRRTQMEVVDKEFEKAYTGPWKSKEWKTWSKEDLDGSCEKEFENPYTGKGLKLS